VHRVQQAARPPLRDELLQQPARPPHRRRDDLADDDLGRVLGEHGRDRDRGVRQLQPPLRQPHQRAGLDGSREQAPPEGGLDGLDRRPLGAAPPRRPPRQRRHRRMIRRRPPRPPVASIRSRLLRPSLAMTASHLRPLAAACVLAALLFAAAAPAHAQYALRASVAAAGATDASGGGFRLRATAGQPAAGRVTGGAYVLGQGFWYPATLADGGGGPALSVTATPLNPPIVVPAGGGEFRFRVTITN